MPLVEFTSLLMMEPGACGPASLYTSSCSEAERAGHSSLLIRSLLQDDPSHTQRLLLIPEAHPTIPDSLCFRDQTCIALWSFSM
jgi:hypothetical protein